MTPLALFLLGCATVFFGTVQAAFSALMRLSLRLMAERGGRSDRLGPYLDDPLQLFIPVRLLLSGCIVAAGVLIARVSDFPGDSSSLWSVSPSGGTSVPRNSSSAPDGR